MPIKSPCPQSLWFRSQVAGWGLVFVETIAVGCESPRLPEVQRSGAFIDLAYDPEWVVCEGTVAAMERYVTLVQQTFDLPPPSSRLRYYWTTQDRLQLRCTQAVLGCFQAPFRRVIATQLPMRHELAHAATAAMGDPNALILEGLAMAYQGASDAGATWMIAKASNIPEGIRAAQRSLYLPKRDYTMAGAFTAYLIRTYGTVRYAQLYDDLYRFSGSRRFDQAFHRVFGVGLTDAIVDFEALMRDCPYAGWQTNLLECDGPPLDWSAGQIVHEEHLDCSDSSAIGAGSRVHKYRTFEVAVAREYTLAIGGEGSESDNLVILGGCENTCEAWTLNVIAPGDDPVTVDLPVGRYWFEFVGPTARPSTVEIVLQPASEL